MHLDPKALGKWAKKQDLSPAELERAMGLPSDIRAAIMHGAARADGLLAARIQMAAASPELATLGIGTKTRFQGSRLACPGSCPACEAPSAVSDDEVVKCMELLRAWLGGDCPEAWIDNAWFTNRSVRDEDVVRSGVPAWLQHAADSDRDLGDGLLALARLLVGPPTTRVRMTFFNLPARDELRARIRLPGGWMGGALPPGLLGQIYPLPTALEFSDYRGFDPFEARLLWVAWRAELDMPPVLPDPIYRRFTDEPTDPAEGLIALTHAVVHPGRIAPLARVIAYQHQGLSVIDGHVSAGYEHPYPEEVFDPLADEVVDFNELFAELEHDPWYYEEALLDFDLEPAVHARALAGFANRIEKVDVQGVATKRAARAATHVTRTTREAEANPAATALDYAIALELLLNDGKGREAISRSLRQAGANLAGATDEERRDIVRAVTALYGASSDYRHGSEPELESQGTKLFKGSRQLLDLEEARAVVRRIAAAVLNLIAEGHESPSDIAEDATFDRQRAAELEAALHRLHGVLGQTLRELDLAARPEPRVIDLADLLGSASGAERADAEIHDLPSAPAGSVTNDDEATPENN